MVQPLIVSIPHKLGKDEAIRRMKDGLSTVNTKYAHLLQVNEEVWSGDRLAFQITAMRQQASGTIDVTDDHVRLEVTLPWLLAGIAHGAQAMIRERGLRMLEKK
ncbi:polyhydroxyalkanoic acid synthase [Afipia sp. Root123D2]|uniref:polyhydroxyalkanoic acid system family protein n=1 Tax=Afipia sp. Root123D2 TaxID=1736436 RepID=UPI0006FD132B|nr:polyhydroxyalkanoic acid system family protein [Afipia sp. Root123D2]KQW21496.1 polyhydroxyalkanoic acid synthase [Afipia sp. Root123D2]